MPVVLLTCALLGLQDRCHRLGQTKAVTVYRLVRQASVLILDINPPGLKCCMTLSSVARDAGMPRS